jgi:hypothetical protein
MVISEKRTGMGFVGNGKRAIDKEIRGVFSFGPSDTVGRVSFKGFQRYTLHGKTQPDIGRSVLVRKITLDDHQYIIRENR